MAKKLSPVHPGEILREEFLVPLKLIPCAVAAALNVPRTRIERIAREEKPVTADTALRLGKFFKTGAAFWMNIQARFDLETAPGTLYADYSGNPAMPAFRNTTAQLRRRTALCLKRLDLSDSASWASQWPGTSSSGATP